MYWRNTGGVTNVYPSCQPLDLPEGLIISPNYHAIQHVKESVYKQTCYKNAIPMLNTNVGLFINKFTKPLPLVEQSWHEYTRNSDRGSFANSVVPIIYSISISAVITWFLSLFVLTDYTIRPSFLLKISTSLSSAYLLVVIIKSIIVLHDQQRDGFLHGAMLLDSINSSVYLNIIDLIVVILLQINQVQVIMRIFSRQKDKRLTFFVGIIATITSQVIWAITKFHNFAAEDDAGDILSAFIYLVRIAMGVCYAALISVFLITKIHYVLANKKIWLLTILTFILIYSPVAFFIADVSNAWVSELSEIFSVVTYVICVVIPWEWCNKFNLIMKVKEKEGVLGRRFYEDEFYELDRYEIFIEEEDNNDNGDYTNQNSTDNGSDLGGQTSTNNNPGQHDLREHSRAKTFMSTLLKTKQVFLNLTDTVIAAGFSIPRSVSVSSPSLDVHRHDNVHLESIGNDLNNSEFPNTNTTNGMMNDNGTGNTDTENLNTTNGSHIRNRRDVFVYPRREVVINLSDEEN